MEYTWGAFISTKKQKKTKNKKNGDFTNRQTFNGIWKYYRAPTYIKKRKFDLNTRLKVKEAYNNIKNIYEFSIGTHKSH